MKRIVVGSTNAKKKKELKAILKGVRIKVIDLADLEMHLPIVVENGKTFRQNAIKKALIFSRFIKGVIIADDSGLEVSALDGRPGVRSARFAHTKATDRENNLKLLSLMKNVPAKKRQAAFVCSVAVAEKGNLIGTSEGRCKGAIGFESKGKNGFGYDPLFTPEGGKKTFAELQPASKNKISHRGKALNKAKTIIQKGL